MGILRYQLSATVPCIVYGIEAKSIVFCERIQVMKSIDISALLTPFVAAFAPAEVTNDGKVDSLVRTRIGQVVNNKLHSLGFNSEIVGGRADTYNTKGEKTKDGTIRTASNLSGSASFANELLLSLWKLNAKHGTACKVVADETSKCHEFLTECLEMAVEDVRKGMEGAKPKPASNGRAVTPLVESK